MKFCNGLVILVSIATVLAFAGLIPLGTWQDDFLTLHNYHQQGGDFLIERLRHWSPRPLSEALIYLYAVTVHHYGLPLIGAFIALFWLVLAGALLLPPSLGKRGFLTAIAMLAMLLLGHPVTEFFYWPDGVAAYLPTLAAAALLLALDWGGWSESKTGLCWTFIALMTAAASSEVGAMFTIIYVGLLVISRSVQSRRQMTLMVIPFLLSSGLLCLQYSGRVSQASEIIGDPAIAHHPFATLLAVAKDLPFELLKGDTLRHKYIGLAEGLVIKLLFLVGLYLAMSARRSSPNKRMQRMRLILALALLATAMLTMAAAFYNFGAPCCERHDTLRQNYILIALGSLATLLAARWPSRHFKYAGPILLLALAIPLIAILPRLVAEYRDYAAIVQARDDTWRSGQSVGPDMKFTQTIPNVTGNVYITPDIYRRTANPNADQRAQWILAFFDKQSVEFTPAVNATDRNDAYLIQ